MLKFKFKRCFTQTFVWKYVEKDISVDVYKFVNDFTNQIKLRIEDNMIVLVSHTQTSSM